MEQNKNILINDINELPLFIEKGTLIRIDDDKNYTITKKFMSYFPSPGLNKYGIGVLLRSGKQPEYSQAFGTFKDVNLLNLKENNEDI